MSPTHRALVAYFSCGGTTQRVARTLADALGADLYEIAPQTRYSPADLDWRDPQSRSTVEMKDPASRPALGGEPLDAAAYDVVFVGYPIWWYVAPHIVNAFLEAHDLAGKTVVPFATSGSSGMGDVETYLHGSCPGARLLPGKVLGARLTEDDARAWVDALDLG